MVGGCEAAPHSHVRSSSDHVPDERAALRSLAVVSLGEVYLALPAGWQAPIPRAGNRRFGNVVAECGAK